MVTERYCLLPADLREPGSLATALERAGMDPAAPTLVVSECVLVYLKPQQSAEVVRWLGQHLQCAAMAVYEQARAQRQLGCQWCCMCVRGWVGGGAGAHPGHHASAPACGVGGQAARATAPPPRAWPPTHPLPIPAGPPPRPTHMPFNNRFDLTMRLGSRCC